jgi:hypothetical protein
MTTDWIRKHVNSDLLAKYEAEFAKLRNEKATVASIVSDIKNMNDKTDQLEIESEKFSTSINK